MKNIRNKVFETNSSSSHSVSIYNATHGLYDTITPDSSGVIALTGGEFGWEWEKYNDALTKANYAAVYAAGDQAMTDMLVHVIKEHTGAKEVQLSFSAEYSGGNYSYIDHQSARSEGGDAGKAFDTPLSLKNFVFHPESWLFTGNDNDTAPPNFYDVEFGILYTHELHLDGITQTLKFQDEPGEEALREALDNLSGYHPLSDYSTRRYEDRFSFVAWDRKAIDGTVFSSFEKLKEGKIVLFKTESVYSEDKKREYKGENVIASRDVKFQIKKI
jgi:hypothetical protein